MYINKIYLSVSIIVSLLQLIFGRNNAYSVALKCNIRESGINQLDN